jgi:hypothetical protein
MSKKHKKRSRSRYKNRSVGANPLVWLGGILGIIVVMATLNLWQSGAFAKPPEPSRSEGPGELLPLAEGVRPLSGGHDMALIPQEPPAPQAAPEGASLPHLDLPTTSYDFGRIAGNPDVAHIFAVQNTGTEALEIWNLVTSCGCTTAELSSSVIPPGQRADLTVVFDPDFHRTEGETVRLVWFATNDPTQPWAEVRIEADVY